MDFFEEQDRARRNTWRLIGLLVVALCLLIGFTSAVALWLLDAYDDDPLVRVAQVSAVVVGVVVLGWLFKAIQLRDGGHAVAQRLGGRLISLSAETPGERRVLAVVEEMAIASGMPVPSVYLLEDSAINAFAAGYTPDDAVIGITRGAMAYLSRDELQGVIAHEFSHILHGDMRLNTRLVSVLHGMLLIGLIGRWFANNGSHASRGIARKGSLNESPVVFVILLGVALTVIGYAGTLAGHLIKAAVNRQREYLADASAVRYTRNVHGILGALKRIGGFAGSILQARHSAEYSHLYFSQGTAMAFGGWLDTHPALERRIRRLEPGWDGDFDGYQRGHGMLPPSSLAEGFTGLAHSLSHIGEPGVAEIACAQAVLSALPWALHQAAHETTGAQALLCGLLLGREPVMQERRHAWLRTRLDVDVLAALDALRGPLEQLGDASRLPLLELSFPALRQLHPSCLGALATVMRDLMAEEGRVVLLDWTLLRIVERNLRRRPLVVPGALPLQALESDTATLLAALARNGNPASPACAASFEAAWASLPYPPRPLANQPVGSVKALDQAVRRLERLKPLQKPRLLKAMARCIEHDGQVSVIEGELLRAVADILDCPMPPLLDDAQERDVTR